MYRAGPGSPREQFLDQFERDGSDWLYRYRQMGAGYRVTDAEKDGFVAAYDRGHRRFTWIASTVFAILVLALLAAYFFSDFSLDKNFSSYFPLGAPLLAAILQSGYDFIAFRAPLRALGQRTPISPAWSKAARRQFTLERLPLTVPVGTATVTALLLLYFALERPPIGPVSLVLIVGSVTALIWALVQGVRKWQFDRADYVASNLT